MYNETDVRLRYSGAMEIARFLSRYPPFDSLTIDENERIAGQLQIEFFPKGSTILRQAGEPAAFMYIVRKGSVELTSDGVVFDQLLEGECFGHPSLLSALGPAFNVAATEDTLCYLLHQRRSETAVGNWRGAHVLGRESEASNRAGLRGSCPDGVRSVDDACRVLAASPARDL